MAKEITATVRLQLTNGNLIDQGTTVKMAINQTNQERWVEVIEVTPAPLLTTIGVVHPGLCKMRDLDPFNTVRIAFEASEESEYGTSTPTPKIEIRAGEANLFRFTPGTTGFWAMADTAEEYGETVSLEVIVYGD